MSGIKIQVKRGSSSQWTSLNPVLAEGEIGLELDTNKFKFGKGGTYHWNDLDYVATGSGSSYITSIDTNYFTVTSGELLINFSGLETKLITDGFATKTYADNKASQAQSAAESYAQSLQPIAGTDYIAFSEKGVAGGVAELDGDTYVPDSQINPDIARKDYVDNVAAQAVSTSESYASNVASQAQSAAQTYADGKASQAVSTAESYADNVAAQAVSTAESYAANVASQAQSAAQTYATNKASQAQSAAQNYADGKASQAVSTAESYASNVASQAQSASELYTDSKISTEVQDRNSAISTGIGTAESYASNVASQAISTAETYTNNQISNLVNSAPSTLDTLKELADAIGDDPNFAVTVANHIANAVTNAESYADNVAAQAVSTAESYAANVASQAQSAAQTYATNKASQAQSAAQTYADGKASQAISTAESYADGILTTSEHYADNVAAQAVSTAESYAANVASQAQSAAQTYATNKASQAQSAAQTYADGILTSAESYANGKFAPLSGATFTGDVVITATDDSNSTSAGALVVDGGIGVAKSIHAGGTAYFGAPTSLNLNDPMAFFTNNVASYTQVGLQNTNDGAQASADLVITANNGTDTTHYVDLGIASSGYNYPDYSLTGPNDAYLLVEGGDLALNAGTGGKGIVFAAGGFQITDKVGKWDETKLEVNNDFKVDGNTTLIGTLNAGDTTVTSLDSGNINAVAQDTTHPPLQVFGHTSQSGNLQEWLDSSNNVLASVDKLGNITAPTFSGTAIGNLSYYGHNDTGSTITKGTPIYLTGLDTSNNPTIAPAVVSDPTKMPAAGIAAQDIPAGTTAQIVFVGQIHGVDTSAWNYNDIIYVGASGVTNVKPTNASYSVQPIGTVEKVGSALNNGTILVNCTGTYAHVPNTISIPGNITTTSGTFSGNGSGLTTLNASNLSSGTVPSSRLSLTSSDIPSLTHSKISDFQTTVLGYTLDQFSTPVDNVAMGGYRITGLGTPTQSSDAANKSYVDALTTGLSIKQAVNYATAAVLPNTPTYANGTADQSQGTGIGATLTGSGNHTLQVDGVNVTNNQRILVKNQATATQNGIYVVTNAGAGGPGGSAWILTRSSDADNSIAGELRPNAYVSVLAGNTNIGTSWVITGTGTATTPAGAIKIGTDSVTFNQFNGAASYVAGAGLTLTGLTFDVNTADSDRIVVNADNIDLALVTRSDTVGANQASRVIGVTTDSYGRVTGITTAGQNVATTSTQGIAQFDSSNFAVTAGNVTIKSGGVSNTNLANSSLTIGSTNISLGATQTSLAGLSSVTSTSFSGNLTGNVIGNASTVTNGVYTTDTGTVTNTMLAGSIADSKLNQITTSGKVANSATTATQANTANAIVARDASGNFTANIITANLAGNADTATTATNATNATKSAITDDTTSNVTDYIAFVSASTGNNAIKVSSTKLTYNPSTGIISATQFSGSGAGLTNIPNSALTNSSFTINGTSISLGDTKTITAAAGTLTGSTLNSGVTASSLTSVGTLTNLTVTNTITGSVSGNAGTVTNGVYTTDTATVTNTMLAGSIADSKLNTISTSGKVSNSATTATSANTASAIVARDSSGNFTAGTITAALSGNASTATTLATPRAINGVNFDGSAAITVTAAAGTLTGSTLNSGVTASSLTSIGTLTSLSTTGDVTVGGNLTVNGTTTTVNSTTISVADANIEIAKVATPTDVTANGGGITIKGATDKTFNWYSSTGSLTSSENIDLATGKTYKISGTTVLSATQVLGKGFGTTSGDIATIDGSQTLTNKTISGGSNTITNISNSSLTNSSVTINGTSVSLGASATVTAAAGTLTGSILNSGVTTSSLTSVGTITSGTWNGTTIAIANGGTGQTTAAAAANALLPSQTSNSGKYLTTDGSGNLSWGSVSGYSAPTIGTTSITSGGTFTTLPGVTSINGATVPSSGTLATLAGTETLTNKTLGASSTTTLSANTITAVDTVALNSFTTIKYIVSIKQGTKIRSSEILVTTDGTSVNYVEYGTITVGSVLTGFAIGAAISSTNSVLNITITDAATTNATIKINKVVM